MANDAEIDLSIDEAGTVTTTLRRGRAELRMGAKAEPATTLSRGETLAFQGDGKRLAIAGEAQIPESWPDGWAESRSIRLDRLVAAATRSPVLPTLLPAPATADLLRLGMGQR